MSTKIIFLFALLGIRVIAYSQSPAIQWQNTIGGNKEDLLISVIQIPNDGYLLAGSSESDSIGDKSEISNGGFDYWIVKLDTLGNIIWQNTIGGNHLDLIQTVSRTNDGGYILGGTSRSDSTGDKTENSQGLDDYWIVKIDSIGNIQWQNTIGGSDNDFLTSIEQTNDGGYIVGGLSASNISGDKTENNWDSVFNTSDYWVLKLDSVGNIQWQNTIGGTGGDALFITHQTMDGGFILGGHSSSDSTGDKTENPVGGSGGLDYWVIKLNVSGSIQWQNTIGGYAGDWLYDIQQTFDGGYILGGTSNSNISGDKTENTWGDKDFWVVKLDSIGIIQWQNDIGGTAEDEFYRIELSNDGGFIIGGYSYSNISGDKVENNCQDMDYWILSLDSIGNIKWQKTMGGTGLDWFRCLIKTADGGYLVGGWSSSNISCVKSENSINASDDYWIIKLAPDSVTGISNNNPTGYNFIISPNPTTGIFTIRFDNNNSEKVVQILDGKGNVVYKKNNGIFAEVEINLSGNSKGIYLLNVIENEKSYVKKISLQ